MSTAAHLSPAVRSFRRARPSSYRWWSRRRGRGGQPGRRRAGVHGTAGFCHTLPASAKPVTLFAEIPGTPTYTRAICSACPRSWPLTATLVLLFALTVWPLLGVPVLKPDAPEAEPPSRPSRNALKEPLPC